MKRINRAESVLVISGGLIVFFLIYKITALLIIALCLIVIGLFSAYLTARIAWLWMGFAKILGYISSRIILTLIFYLILTPLALIRKLFKKKTPAKNDTTNFFSRHQPYSASDLERPF
jgi:hypothetical protein